jgi:hypothetical protein
MADVVVLETDLTDLAKQISARGGRLSEVDFYHDGRPDDGGPGRSASTFFLAIQDAGRNTCPHCRPLTTEVVHVHHIYLSSVWPPSFSGR